MNEPIRTLLLPVVAALSLQAQAQTQTQTQPAPEASRWSVAVGPVHLAFHTRAEVYAGGPIAGAGVEASSGYLLGLEIAYAFDQRWTARLGVGTPVDSDMSGTGSIAAFGKLGSVKGGPATLTLTYSPGTWGSFRPNVGGGMSYMKVFSSKDGALQDVKVDPGFGGVLFASAEWLLGGGYSVGYTLQKIYLKTNATGTAPALGNIPTTATVRLDPLVQSITVRKQF